MNSTSTFLAFPADQAIPAFRQMATAWELPVADEDDTLLVTLDHGEIRVGPEKAGTSVRVAAADAGNLQMLRDLLTEQLTAHGLAPSWEGASAGRQPANLSIAQVVEVVDLSPSYRRVTLEGPDLARFAHGGLHFRLLFGPEGAGWPEVNEQGVTQWPGGPGSWHRPVYTTRDIVCRGEAATLSFDVFLHEGGRVTEWTEKVQPGDEIALTGPGGETGQRDAQWRAFIGDETALPAIARMLTAAPETLQGEAVIFVPEQEDTQPLSHPEGVNVRWVVRSSGETPLDALSAMVLPQTSRHVFFAAEKTEALSARGILMDRGLAKGEFVVATYWTQS